MKKYNPHKTAHIRQVFHCSAFTLIEALVVLGIVGLLAGLLLPAIQSVRESARRTACFSNLGQIARGLNSYCATFNVYPSACGLPNYARSGSKLTIAEFKQYSLFAQLLSNIEQPILFNSINFNVELVDFHLFTQKHEHFAPNSTVYRTSLAILSCPSDGSTAAAGSVNYRANIGSDRWMDLGARATDGAFSAYRYVSAAEVADGLSNTVAFSEKLRGHTALDVVDLKSAMVFGGLGSPHSADESLSACRERNQFGNESHPGSGLIWAVGTLSQTLYNHVLLPNERIPDCVLGLTNPIVGLIGARSNHPSCVSAAKLDGSVASTKDAISREVWRSLGTRSGGEIGLDY